MMGAHGNRYTGRISGSAYIARRAARADGKTVVDAIGMPFESDSGQPMTYRW